MGKKKNVAKVRAEQPPPQEENSLGDDTLDQMLAEIQDEFVDAPPGPVPKESEVTPTSTVADNPVGSGTKKRNRRKEKIQQREAERAKSIQEAEAEAQSAPDKRQIEIDALAKIESENGLKEFQVEPDGHCLFHSIADQLEQRYGIKEPASSLRSKAAQIIRENRDLFAPYLLDEASGIVRDAEDYAKELEDTAMWGGDLEIIALSKAYKCPIRIYFGFQPTLTINKDFEGESLNISYHRSMYGLGAHYNSLRDIKKDN